MGVSEAAAFGGGKTLSVEASGRIGFGERIAGFSLFSIRGADVGGLWHGKCCFFVLSARFFSSFPLRKNLAQTARIQFAFPGSDLRYAAGSVLWSICTTFFNRA